jgi:hypothetical protein
MQNMQALLPLHLILSFIAAESRVQGQTPTPVQPRICDSAVRFGSKTQNLTSISISISISALYEPATILNLLASSWRGLQPLIDVPMGSVLDSTTLTSNFPLPGILLLASSRCPRNEPAIAATSGR